MIRSIKSLDIQASPRAEEHNCTRYARHQISAALTQPSSRDCDVRIHAVAFDLSSIHATFFKPLHSLSRTSTLSYLRRCGAALMPQHTEDIMRKKQKDPRIRVTVKVSIEIWDSCLESCNTVYMQKAAAQEDAWARRSVRRSAAGKVASMQ